MSITYDYHLHTAFSGDSDTPMEEMIIKGIELGLTGMCFTEHNDFDYPVTEECPAGKFEVNPDSYLYDLIKYKEKYADKINVLFGVELGLQPHIAKRNAAFAKAHEYDFIIASSHMCNGYDPYYPDFFEVKTLEEAYREYYISILDNIKVFSNFDVYGHLDYIFRYGPGKEGTFSYGKYQDIIDKILEKLISDGKGIELNTKTLGDTEITGTGENIPCIAILRRYKELGGEIITVGSDAHTPDKIAANYDTAASILSDCGFKYYTTFEKRSASFHKI
ncbi:MAG: histidinol-phosphatase HisJ family protein [Lachnospiraceae bacterium]|nr:histidinol-phosphatase HisJ family protein [Lachnospiraceae bacterium]